MKLAKRSRMSTDARREQLLAAGAELLGRRPYDEVSIEEIAAAAGVSKGLLYHYFPTKQDFVLAALERGERELTELTAPDPELDPADQLSFGIDRFLDFVEEHSVAYTAIFRSRGGGEPAIQRTLERHRRERLESLIDSLVEWETAPVEVARTPLLETAVQGWIFFVEGAVLHWLESDGVSREELRELLAQALLGTLQAVDAAKLGAETPR
ncbi:MAG TPA: TetR/AcrR family transcriptional regulator [Solirubrobacterales bacterium]|nr:TetR/AcrR family transcriptional regulator [Solirubrobacterales bacterium]